MGDDPNEQGNSRRWIVQEVENSLRRLSTDYIDLYQIHRPDPDTDIDETLGALTDLVRAGQGPLLRHLDVPGARDRRGAVGGRATRAASGSSASSRRTRCSSAASSATCCRSAQQYGMGVIPWSPLAGGWLSGSWRKGRTLPTPAARDAAARALRPVDRPANQRKLDAADALGAARRRGRDVADPPRDRVRDPATPAVTSAIIGPRTMEQLESQLGAADVMLPHELLDAIDEIVPPGTNVTAGDGGYDPPSLTEPGLRRR